MPTHYTDLALTQNTSNGVHERISDSRLSSGKLKLLHATYTTTTGDDEATDDTLRLCRLIPGALFLPSMAYVVAETGAFSYLEIDLGVEYDDGTTADLDKFVDGMPVLAGGKQEFCPPGGAWTVYNGELTLGGGAATEAETIAGVAATDRVLATITDEGGNTDCYLIAAVPTTDTITFRFNEDPTSGTILQTTVLRTAAQIATFLTPAEATNTPGWLTADLKVVTSPVASKKITFVLPFIGF